MNGIAPCGKCKKVINNIPINEYSKESDGKGGYWYKVLGNAHCLGCGEPLIWFHQPPSDNLIKEFFADIDCKVRIKRND